MRPLRAHLLWLAAWTPGAPSLGTVLPNSRSARRGRLRTRRISDRDLGWMNAGQCWTMHKLFSKLTAGCIIAAVVFSPLAFGGVEP